MKKILGLLLIVNLLFIAQAEPLQIEINKSSENIPPILFLGSDKNEIRNGFFKYINDFNLIQIRYDNNCISKKMHSNQYCFYINTEDNSLSFKDSKQIKTRRYNRISQIDIADSLYQFLNKTDKSPFFDEFIFLAHNENTNKFSLLRSDFDGNNIIPIFQSNKSMGSLSINQQKNKLSYISFERYLPSVVVQHLETNERKVYQFDNYKVNSVSWFDSNNLMVSIAKERENYEIFLFNLETKSLKSLIKGNTDLISPLRLNLSEILVTRVNGYSPKTVIFDIETNKFKNIPISQYGFATDINVLNGELVGVVQENRNFRLAHYNNVKRDDKNILFGNFNLENPNFLTNNNFIILTFQTNNVNRIGIINTKNDFIRSFNLPNMNIVDLVVINK
jgi:hypothetical protein